MAFSVCRVVLHSPTGRALRPRAVPSTPSHPVFRSNPLVSQDAAWVSRVFLRPSRAGSQARDHGAPVAAHRVARLSLRGLRPSLLRLGVVARLTPQPPDL